MSKELEKIEKWLVDQQKDGRGKSNLRLNVSETLAIVSTILELKRNSDGR